MAIEEGTVATGLTRAASKPNGAPEQSGREYVASRLFRRGYEFDFFQSVWLLEQALDGDGAQGESSSAGDERIRIRPHSSPAFPATDIRKIEWLDSERTRAQVTVTFMGLYGVASPLPVYFYDDIGTQESDAEPLRDFLDIFNRRLYKYFYQSWKKYQSVLHPVTRIKERSARVFACLAGMGTPGFFADSEGPPLRLMSLAGLLSSGVRNGLGLQTVVSTMFEGLGVRVQENVPRWVTVRERPSMGDGSMTLGSSALIGQKIRDAAGKFRLVLGPLGLQRFRAFLPDGAASGMLDYLVRLYTTDHLDFDVELVLKTSEVPPMRLGSTQKIGVDAWLGRPAGDTISVIVQYS